MKRLLRFTVISLFVLMATQILCAAEVNLTNEENAAGQFHWGKKINVQIKDMLLPDALAVLLKNTGFDCKVDPDVAMLKVTADFRDVSLRQALTELERVSDTSFGVSNVERSIFIVVTKRPDPSPQVESQDDTVPKDAHSVPIHNYTEIDIIRMLGVLNWEDYFMARTSNWTGLMLDSNSIPNGITSISIQRNSNSNSLFVTGEEAAVTKLAQLVSKLDDEPQKTQQIKIRITRYTLGSVIPESIKLEGQGGSKSGVVTGSQLEALAIELREKGIEPTVVANLATLDSLPVSAGVYGGGALYCRGNLVPAPPIRLLQMQVTPRLDPKDNSIMLSIALKYSADPVKGVPVMTSCFAWDSARIASGMSHAILFSSDSAWEGALTIITATL